jgi:hypothetical protein
MRKGIFGLGVFAFIVAAIAFFLSGATSGANLEPTVPFLYGTNQIIYIVIAVVGLICIIAGLFMRRKF